MTKPPPKPPPPPPATEAAPAVKAESRTLNITVGGEEKIWFQDTPASGYRWTITKGRESELVSIVTYIAEPEPIPDAPIETIVSFSGLKPGNETVELSYVSPCSQQPPPLRAASPSR